MIDVNARRQFSENAKTKLLVEGMKDSIKSMLEKDNPNEEVLKLVVKREDEPKMLEMTGKLGDALAMIYKVVSKPIILPKIFQIKGQVEVTKQPSVEVKNLNELKKYFESLEKTFNNLMLAIQSMPQPQIKLPKIEIPAQVKNDFPELKELLETLNDKLDNIKPASTGSMRKTEELLEFLVNKPVLTPQPVTNVWLNPATGFLKSSSTTVGTTLTTLPGYGQLFNRRSMVIYNNSGNTIYVGGSDVTTGNGIPVPSSNYGMALDVGNNCIVYAIASTGGNDIRVLEVSKDKVGNEPQE